MWVSWPYTSQLLPVRPSENQGECWMYAMLSIFKSEMPLHAVRLHYKQFTPFSCSCKNTYMLVSAWMLDILSILCNSCAKTPMEVLLITCKWKKCGFILMWSTNLDRFQLTALALTWLAYWLMEKGREKGQQSTEWVVEKVCERWIWNYVQFMWFHPVTFLWNNHCIDRQVPVLPLVPGLRAICTDGQTWQN
jgi:hypothetical protein